MRWRTGVQMLLGVTIATWALPAGALSISVVPSASSIAVGNTVTVQLHVGGLGAGTAPSLGVVDLDITVDPAILSFASGQFGDPTLGDQLDLSGFGASSSATANASGVNLFELSLDSAATLDAAQAPSFIVASVSFMALGAGTSTIGLTVNSVGDSVGNPLSASISTASVTALPEPGEAGLMAVGMLLIELKRRRRRRADSAPGS